MKRILAVVLVVLMAVVLFACSTSKPEESATPPTDNDSTTASDSESADQGGSIKIGLSTCSLISQFFEGVNQAAEAAAKENGIELTVVNADGDSATQKTQIEGLISSGVDAVIAIAQDTDAIVSSAADCAAKGIPFVAISRKPADMKDVSLFIGFSNEQSASVDADAIVAAAKDLGYDKIKCIELIGDLNDSNAVERQKGFEAKAKELGIEIVATVATEWDVDTCFSRLTDTVQNTNEFNAIYSPSDILIPSIMSVLTTRNEWVKYGEDGYKIITGIDGDPTAIQAIKDGYVYCTANNDALELGKQAIVQAAEIINNGAPAEKEQMIDAVAVTKDIAESVGDTIWGNVF